MWRCIIFSFIYILVYLDLLNAKKHKIKDEIPSQPSKDEMEGKIVGGTPIPLWMMPHNVQIFNQGAMCSGSILNSWTVVSAAHCFDINNDINEMVIQVGTRYIFDFNADQFAIAELVIHPKYNQTGLFACDIALIFLESPISFSKNTKKAILVNHKRWMSRTQRNFTVSGWGWTEYGGPLSKEGLMMTHLRYIPAKECGQLHKLRITHDMFCLYGDGVRDTCKGDSGGGVFWNGMLVGITSHGDGCAKSQKPSVYTNVYHFKDWIRKEVIYYINVNCGIKYSETLRHFKLS